MPRQSYRHTWPGLTAPLLWLFVYAGVWVSGRIAGLFGLSAAMNGRWEDNIVALFASVPVFLCLWLWLRLYERRTAAGIGLHRPFSGFWTGLVQGLVFVVAVVAAGLLLGVYAPAGGGIWHGFDGVWLLAAVLAVLGTIIQATVTEALWRGWMLQTAASRWGPVAALLFNMVATVLIQGGSALRSPEALVGIVNLTLMAGLLSLWVLSDGRLWRVCGFHAGWNLAMGLGLGLPIDGGRLAINPLAGMTQVWEAPSWLHGGGFGPDGSVLMTVALVAMLVWSLRGRRTGMVQRRTRDEDYDAVDDH